MPLDLILAELRAMLIEVIGAEYALSFDIDMDTSFEADLELESIDLVGLSGQLRDHYGDKINFAAFIAERELEEIIALTVGELVGFVVDALGATEKD